MHIIMYSLDEIGPYRLLSAERVRAEYPGVRLLRAIYNRYGIYITANPAVYSNDPSLHIWTRLDWIGFDAKKNMHPVGFCASGTSSSLSYPRRSR